MLIKPLLKKTVFCVGFFAVVFIATAFLVYHSTNLVLSLYFPNYKNIGPPIEELNQTINEIRFENSREGFDNNVIGDNIKKNLGAQWGAELPQGSTVIISFLNYDSILSLSPNINKQVAVNVSVEPKFDPYDEKYLIEKPSEGFVIKVALLLKQDDKQEEIIMLITKVIKNSIPKVYDRREYFKDVFPKENINTNTKVV